MENPLFEKMQEFLKKDKDYPADKLYLEELVENYNSDAKSNSLGELYQKIFSHANSHNWSRRKLEALIYELVVRDQSKGYSSHLYDTLTNLLDDLSGNVAWDSITRLNEEPIDKEELCKYVRSGSWRNNTVK